MSKKKMSNNKICEAIIEEYIINSDLDKISNIETYIPKLVENNLGCKILAYEAIYDDYNNVYRIACKFIQKYNKSIKYNRRKLKQYEFGYNNTILAKHDPKLIELTKYVLEDGKYFAKLDKSTYCVLKLETRDEFITSTIYFIGDKWKKWKHKFDNKIEKYNKLVSDIKSETININNKKINTVFKSFDYLIFNEKENIIKYIDNWIECIPIYYDKYNAIPKLSILLHGVPGTGKSSFYKALAKYLNINKIKVLNADYFMNNNINTNNRFSAYDINEPALYAIDDIDCICKSREKNNDKDNSIILSNLLSFLDNPPTFDYTAKNGIMYPISIVVATTNYYDKLDSAVKRHGRFDLTIEMKNFDKEKAQKMCDIYDLKLENIVKDSNKNNFSISPAKLQAICLKNIDNKLKNSVNDFEYIDGKIVIHRI